MSTNGKPDIEYPIYPWPGSVTPGTEDPYPQYLTLGEMQGELANPNSVSSSGLNNAFARRWQAATAYVSGDLALAPDGTIIQRNADGTSRGSYDATEQAAWTVKTGAAAATLTDVASTVTANGALTVSKHNPVDATSGARAMTVADATGAGKFVSFEKTDASVNAVTVTLNLRGIPGSTVVLVGQNEAFLLASKADGSWWPVAGHKTKAWLDATYAGINTALPTTYTGTVKGAWAGNVAYSVADVVTVESGLVRCVIAHTSNAAGFTYDREKWEVIPIPVLHGGTTVRVRGLDLTNQGTVGTTVPVAGVFQRRPKKFNYKAERILWSVQQASDITVSGSGSSVATGTTKPLGSAVITVPASGTTNATLPTRTAFDVTGGFFRVPLTISDTNNRYFELQVSSDGAWTNYHAGALLYSGLDAINGAAQTRMYGIPVTEMTAVGTGATLTAITAARIQTTNSTSSYTIEVERIGWHPNSADKAKVVIWFDDGGLTNQLAAMKVMAKYGFPFSIAAIANNMTGSAGVLTANYARHLQDVYQAQIAVHAYGGSDHNVGAQTGAPLLEALLDYQHFGAAMGFTGVEDLAYWSAGLQQDAAAGDMVTVRKLFRSARTTAGRFPETLPPMDPFRTNANSGGTNATMQAFVTKAVPYKGCAQFVYHALSTQNLTDLTNFCIWLDTQRATVDVVTAAQAFDPLCMVG